MHAWRLLVRSRRPPRRAERAGARRALLTEFQCPLETPMIAKTDQSLNHLRIITKKELRILVPYTPQQILRLENGGKFPKRIKIGDNRVAWRLLEVGEWLRA